MYARGSCCTHNVSLKHGQQSANVKLQISHHAHHSIMSTQHGKHSQHASSIRPRHVCITGVWMADTRAQGQQPVHQQPEEADTAVPIEPDSQGACPRYVACPWRGVANIHALQQRDHVTSRKTLTGHAGPAHQSQPCGIPISPQEREHSHHTLSILDAGYVL
jgi:hypothetical protein